MNKLLLKQNLAPRFSAASFAQVQQVSRKVKTARRQNAMAARLRSRRRFCFPGFKRRKHQSADFDADETRLTRTGNRYLRYYFCEAANCVRLQDADYAAYYDRKFHEVRLHQHKRALVLTARKLVRLVVRLLTTNQPYRARRPNQS